MKKKKKVLVVDDNPAINEAIQLILEDAGYKVVTTTDSRKVAELIKQQPDLILLDIWMPYVDGREVCKALKADTLTKHIPVIIVSAARDTKIMAKEAGADTYIIKPFEMKKLLTKVAKYIK